MEIFDKTVAAGEEILRYIPQRPPVVMVDTFHGIDGAGSYCSLTVGEDTLLCEGGTLDECGVTEHVAQSAALRVGYVCLSQGKPVPVGFIGSVNNLTVHSLPAAGERIRSRVTVVQEVMNVSLVEATVETWDGRPVCECRMKIFLQEE